MKARSQPLALADLAALRDTLQDRTRAQERLAAEAQRVAAEARRVADQALRDANLFRDTVRDVAPLDAPVRVQHRRPPPEPVALQRARDEAAALAESISDEFDADLLLEADGQLSWRREDVSPEVVRKLRRGHWIVQGELDLHGERVDGARERLGAFLRDAIKHQRRCVRIVHGKGHGSVGKQPVLKGKVKNWLIQKDEVLAFCQAREHDGGGGALIVLLRPC